MSHQTVSVVVTTRNEADKIGMCLQSIAEQTHKDIEIIVVDNHSADGTREIARRYTNLVFTRGPERSAQRNFGMMQVASGNYLLYLDADMILSPGVISSCLGFSIRNHCRALHIPEIVLGTGYWSCVRRFERSFYNGTVIDGARFFEKALFLEIGGFDETLSGPEDWDLDKRIKQKAAISLLQTGPAESNETSRWPLADLIRTNGVDPMQYDSVIYHNESEFNIGDYLGKKAYYVGSFGAYKKKWSGSDADLKKQMGIIYRLFGVFVENGKWKQLLLHIRFSAGIYLLKVLIGGIYLSRRSTAARA